MGAGVSLVGTKIADQDRVALITGITGQDGSYLAEFLLGKGYSVHGLVRPDPDKGGSSRRNIGNIRTRVSLHIGDVSNEELVRGYIANIRPNEVYHLATEHEVSISAENYTRSRSVNLDSAVYFLSAIKDLRPECRYFYASSSNVFGSPLTSPQNEETAFNPESMYSVTKTAGMQIVRMFRSQGGVFACSGILFNHESPRRDVAFLPRKITSTAARIKLGFEKELELGDLDARKDWGFAGDFVEAMWFMLQADTPRDYVIGTGETHAVRDILDIAFGMLDLDWKRYVRVNPKFIRPKAKTEIVADISKIKRDLGWAPRTNFKELIQMMLEEDLRLSRS
jgi:GDPmannose 4,6-dehydratase